MMNNILLIDFGSTYTKVTAVDLDAGAVLGTASTYTTVETGIEKGLENALEILKEKTGIAGFTKKLACSSAAGGLKMVAVGLVPKLTAEAAKLAALSAGAKVIKVYSYELTGYDADEIERLKPDIVLLSGGTDGGDKETIIHNAEVIAAIKHNFPVVIAGNRCAGADTAGIIADSGRDVALCENVMPEINVLNIEPAREAIRNVFVAGIVKAKGLSEVQGLLDDIVMPTPKAVMDAVSLLSSGYKGIGGLGDLMAVDIGGATCDVYSASSGTPSTPGTIVKGLQEPFVKRTVEGDLGIRYNAVSVVENAGIEFLESITGLTGSDIREYAEKLAKCPQVLPGDDERMTLLDQGIARAAARLSVNRHSGRLEPVNNICGVSYIQTGKDLTGVGIVVGTGGPVIYSDDAASILREALFDDSDPMTLKPKNPVFMLDKKYILPAMGLLSGRYPEIALELMKMELVRI
jgi:uncharacterized protein (TIGR01319 family)